MKRKLGEDGGGAADCELGGSMPIAGRTMHLRWKREGICRRVSLVVHAMTDAFEKVRIVSGSCRAMEMRVSRIASWNLPEKFIPVRRWRGEVSPPPTGPRMKGIPRLPMKDGWRKVTKVMW